MTTTIRPVRDSDHAAWQALWTDYLAFYETTLPEAVKQTAFERLLDDGNRVHGLIAEKGGKPVGLVHYIFHDHMWRPEGICYLQDLYADPSVRGTGVGRALIEEVYARADAAGVARVYWLTQDFNTSARQLYDRVGKLSPFIRYDRP